MRTSVEALRLMRSLALPTGLTLTPNEAIALLDDVNDLLMAVRALRAAVRAQRQEGSPFCEKALTAIETTNHYDE